MKIAKRYKIFGQWYIIETGELAEAQLDGDYANLIRPSHRIKMSIPDCTISHLWESLLHEAFHVYFTKSGLDRMIKDKDLRESIIECLSCGAINFLTENGILKLDSNLRGKDCFQSIPVCPGCGYDMVPSSEGEGNCFVCPNCGERSGSA